LRADGARLATPGRRRAGTAKEKTMDDQTMRHPFRTTVAFMWCRALALLAAPVTWDVLLPDLQISLLALP
jgi:hypothetical protein